MRFIYTIFFVYCKYFIAFCYVFVHCYRVMDTDTDCTHTICHTEPLDFAQLPIQQMATVFQILSNESRLKMVLVCLNCERTVGEIVELTGSSQSLVSHNLRQLRELRILKVRKCGRHQYYSLSDYHIYHIISDLAHHIRDCT